MFVDGLVNNDQLKMKRLRDYSDTLQGAISIATNEQNLRARVNLSSYFHSPYKSERREEPCILLLSKLVKTNLDLLLIEGQKYLRCIVGFITH